MADSLPNRVNEMTLDYIYILVFGEPVHFESGKFLQSIPEHRIGSSSCDTAYYTVSLCGQSSSEGRTGIEEKVVSLS
jgi:hypothetical protein